MLHRDGTLILPRHLRVLGEVETVAVCLGAFAGSDLGCVELIKIVRGAVVGNPCLCFLLGFLKCRVLRCELVRRFLGGFVSRHTFSRSVEELLMRHAGVVDAQSGR